MAEWTAPFALSILPSAWSLLSPVRPPTASLTAPLALSAAPLTCCLSMQTLLGYSAPSKRARLEKVTSTSRQPAGPSSRFDVYGQSTPGIRGQSHFGRMARRTYKNIQALVRGPEDKWRGSVQCAAPDCAAPSSVPLDLGPRSAA